VDTEQRPAHAKAPKNRHPKGWTPNSGVRFGNDLVEFEGGCSVSTL
jgi:hypothetical protein